MINIIYNIPQVSVDNSVDDSVFGGNKSAEAEAEEITDDKGFI